MLMAMQIAEVEAFVAIVRARGFTRAAQALRLSQPAISRRIDLLEQELGAPLFSRGREGARLTPAGDAFLPFAEQLLAAARDGASAVRALAAGNAGQVSLALVGTLASGDFVARLGAFRRDCPDVRVALRTARSDEVSALVRQGECALGVRYFADPSPSVTSLHAFDERLVVVCAAGSRLVDPAATEASALAGAPWLGFPRGTGSSGEPFVRLLERQLARAGLDEAEIVEVDSLTAQKRLIEADFGLGLLPESSVDEEVRLGTLRVVPVAALATAAPVFVIHRQHGHLDPATRRLLAALTAPQSAGTALPANAGAVIT
jgi:DNA-binding transcriptional LysR family regulator